MPFRGHGFFVAILNRLKFQFQRGVRVSAGAFLLLLVPLSSVTQVQAQPNLNGQSGLINMPDARIAPDGAWRIGLGRSDPYLGLWGSVSILPFIEVSGRYTEIRGIPGFNGKFAESYGNYKDKAADAKLVVMQESDSLPALAIGVQDIQGTGLFQGHYLAANKKLGNFDVSLGVGDGRIDGVFGGVRYRPQGLSNLALVAEWDANDYAADFNSVRSGAANRKQGPSFGVEYKWGWLGIQASYQQGTTGLNGYLTIPLSDKEFVPKLDEPEPYTKLTVRPTTDEWNADRQHLSRLVNALHQQDFKNIGVHLDSRRLELDLTNSRISHMSRAIGRAARVALLLSPRETNEIRITFTVNDLPVATYTFVDLNRLRRYFAGAISRKELINYVRVDYASPDALHRRESVNDVLAGFETEQSESNLLLNDGGDAIAFLHEDKSLNRIRVHPKLSLYINDPSGAFRYDVFMRATMDRRLSDEVFFRGAVDATVVEDVSKVDNPSNSLLPHVRSDIAEYKKGNKVKINRLVLNKYYQPAERVYARASAGIYEEMYAGAGGQVLYQPRRGNWTSDLTVDALRQRDFDGAFGLRNYSTVTALAALHYRLPAGMMATVRAGRFLARDEGARVEFKRRFPSGFEMGLWYTVTNGNDITSPGSPTDPYHDKGIFLSMPLNTMLTKDTQSVARMSVAPWTRDVGQMVESPGDLYEMLEKSLVLDFHDHDGLHGFGDVDDDYTYNLPSLGTSLADQPYLARFQNDVGYLGSNYASSQALGPLALGIGATALSSALDEPADDFVKDRQSNRAVKAVSNVGSGLPLLAAAVSGVLALDTEDPRLAGTAMASLQAGLFSAVAGVSGKYVVGRSRPSDDLGANNFEPMKSTNADSSFPSIHSAVSWAVLTPYAKEYDMPWLYGLAAITNLGRVAGRNHWVSDTVAGGLLGYALGNAMWESGRQQSKDGVRFGLLPDGVEMSWRFW